MDSPGPGRPRRLNVVGTPTAKDPVCGMMVPVDAPERATFEGNTYVFCCPGCRAKFEKDPRAYLEPDAGSSRPSVAPAPPTSPTAAGTWTNVQPCGFGLQA